MEGGISIRTNMAEVVTPASRYDVACCLGKCQSIVWQCLKLQLELSQTWALRDETGEAVIVAGLWPREDGKTEAWFLARPAAERYMKQIIRTIRLTLEGTAYPEIEVRIATKAGARIARLCRFSLGEKQEIGVETWSWQNSLAVVEARVQSRCKDALRTRTDANS